MQAAEGRSFVEPLGQVGELKLAIDPNDRARVARLMTGNPELHTVHSVNPLQ